MILSQGFGCLPLVSVVQVEIGSREPTLKVGLCSGARERRACWAAYRRNVETGSLFTLLIVCEC
jgi:hypothetical protein